VCFDSPYNVRLKLSHPKKKSARFYHKCVQIYKYPLFLSAFHQTWIFLTDFWTLKYQISSKSIQWSWDVPRRWTDMMKLLSARLRRHLKAPDTYIHKILQTMNYTHGRFSSPACESVPNSKATLKTTKQQNCWKFPTSDSITTDYAILTRHTPTVWYTTVLVTLLYNGLLKVSYERKDTSHGQCNHTAVKTLRLQSLNTVHNHINICVFDLKRDKYTTWNM
jgi:hypothetical protein